MLFIIISIIKFYIFIILILFRNSWKKIHFELKKAITRFDGVPISTQTSTRWFLPDRIFRNSRIHATIWIGRNRRGRCANNRIMLFLLLIISWNLIRRFIIFGKKKQRIEYIERYSFKKMHMPYVFTWSAWVMLH